MTAVARRKLANSCHGTMLPAVTYTHDIEGFVAPAVWLRAALPGKS